MIEEIEQLEPTARRPTATPALRQSVTRIALEILIGFVGVYAAFALTAYKERRDLVDRRHQIKRALIVEIREITERERNNAPIYARVLESFDSSVKAGHPAPKSFFESVDLGSHVWEAAKQGGGLTLIDVPTFVELSQFYNQNSNMFGQYAQLREITMHDILPKLNDGGDAFVDPRTRKSMLIMNVYRAGLARLAGFSSSLVADGDQLIPKLSRDTL